MRAGDALEELVVCNNFFTPDMLHTIFCSEPWGRKSCENVY